MIRLDASSPPPPRDGIRRRDFLHAGAISMAGLGLPGWRAARAGGSAVPGPDVHCIMLCLVGGPSQLDTWDPKPDAPAEIRGPFRPIETKVPGTRVTEVFPRLAGVMDKVSIVRSVHHSAAAVHATGHQLTQTGRLFGAGVEHPHMGSVLAYLKGPKGGMPPHVLLPRPIGKTGGTLPHGQTAGYLGAAFDPFVLNADPNAPGFKGPTSPPAGSSLTAARQDRRRSLRPAIEEGAAAAEVRADALLSNPEAREAFDLGTEPDAVRDRYGRTRFGQSCLLARRLVERGVRFVTVNMFETVFHETTWDSHGSAPFRSIGCYADEVGPNFDNAYSALIEDLARTGLLGQTMVLALGEFGRSPKINAAGGRDHHPACWSALMAGGPIQGGRIVGASDEIGHSPADRPVSPGEIAATVFKGLGLDPLAELPGPQGRPMTLVDPGIEPIHELF